MLHDQRLKGLAGAGGVDACLSEASSEHGASGHAAQLVAVQNMANFTTFGLDL